MSYVTFLLVTCLLCADDRVQSWASPRELVVMMKAAVVLVVIYCPVLRVKRPWSRYDIRCVITNGFYI
jgi:hypothetical protein